MKLINLTILVCLYNKNISDSETIQSLLKIELLLDNIELIIWDNSLTHHSVEILNSQFKKLKYVHTPENLPLSKIYNRVIEEQKENDSYLMICDDDSTIPKTFFIELKKAITLNKDIKLFLPQISSNNCIVSPAKNYIIKSTLFKNLGSGIISSKYLTAINSCMVISNKVFSEGFRYDERLSFYGTDNYFMYNFSKKYSSLYLLKQKIEHKLSMNEDDVSNKLRIFRQIKSASRIIYTDNLFKAFLNELNITIVCFKLVLKYKKLEFFHD